MQQVVRWPLREALLSYVARLKEAALQVFRFESLMWAVLAPHAKKKSNPPKVPAILTR